tara:strand:- start:5015 stop:5347 length:333 start_codon:yes stop_codon:yes gene_type:complete
LTTDRTLGTFPREQNQISDDTKVLDHYNHIVTQCLGQREIIKPDFSEQRILSGDRYLFCTDGISGQVSLNEKSHGLAARNSPNATLDQLIQLVLEKGASDNVTGVVVFVG